jgi:hypothetical protein
MSTRIEPGTVLTAAELAARWKLFRRDGTTPNTGRVAYLIDRGELPGAFRLRLGGEGRGGREWRIPLADVEAFERRHRAGEGRSEAEPDGAEPKRRPAARATVTGSDGVSRLAKGRK